MVFLVVAGARLYVVLLVRAEASDVKNGSIVFVCILYGPA